jgi:hypothetical protein
MLDDANDLVIAGQIFANSQPHGGWSRSHDLPHLMISLELKNLEAF